MKVATVQSRIDEKVKKDAEEILNTLGMSMSDGIRIFLSQVVLQGGMPFDVKIPEDKISRADDSNANAAFDRLVDQYDPALRELAK